MAVLNTAISKGRLRVNAGLSLIHVANPTATLLFQMQRCWMAVSKCAADTDLDRVQSSLRARSSVRIERWSPEPKVRGSNPLGRIARPVLNWPFLFWFQSLAVELH